MNYASFDADQAFWAAKSKCIITVYIIYPSIYLSITTDQLLLTGIYAQGDGIPSISGIPKSFGPLNVGGKCFWTFLLLLTSEFVNFLPISRVSGTKHQEMQCSRSGVSQSYRLC